MLKSQAVFSKSYSQLPVKFFKFFKPSLYWFNRHAQRAKQTVANSLGVGQVNCPNVSFTEGFVFTPQGDLHSEQLFFNHHAYSIAQGVGHPQSHQIKT